MLGTLRQGYIWLLGGPYVARDERRHLINLSIVAVSLALITAPLFGLGLFDVIRGDHDLHLHLIEKGIESGNWPVHFLFPAMVYVLAGFSHDYTHLAQAALFILTACVVAKGCITYAILARSCPRLPSTINAIDLRWSRETLLLMVTIALLIATPILRPWQTSRIYIGQVSPNVWHNPTILVCWPLAILLFFAAYDFLRKPKRGMLAAIAILAMLSVLAKPNYFLAFAPVFGLMCLWRYGLTRVGFISQLAMLPTVAVLFWQLTASFSGSGAMRAEKTIAFVPFDAWQLYSRSIPLSLQFSLAFPVSYLIVFRRSLVNRQLLLFAWLVTLSALVWMACFAEVSTADGSVDPDFNFSWGSHLAVFVLFLVTAIDLCNNPNALQVIARHSNVKWQARLPWIFLGAHATTGTLYLIRQAIGKGFF
jgi:hypothetical protein